MGACCFFNRTHQWHICLTPACKTPTDADSVPSLPQLSECESELLTHEDLTRHRHKADNFCVSTHTQSLSGWAGWLTLTSPTGSADLSVHGVRDPSCVCCSCCDGLYNTHKVINNLYFLSSHVWSFFFNCDSALFFFLWTRYAAWFALVSFYLPLSSQKQH